MANQESNNEDYSRDDLHDVIGQEYVADNIDEIIQYYHVSHVAMAAINAHVKTISAAEAEMKKAQLCIENEA